MGKLGFSALAGSIQRDTFIADFEIRRKPFCDDNIEAVCWPVRTVAAEMPDMTVRTAMIFHCDTPNLTYSNFTEYLGRLSG